jgi:hypothetical protein
MPEGPKIIAMAGMLGAGKDTAASFLINEQDYRHTFFAKRLKQALMIVYDLTWEEVNDRVLKEMPHPNLGGMSPRRALQLIGTEGFRVLIDSETWINGVYRDVKKALSENQSVVIADCRFLNEAHAIQSWGGAIIVIEDPAMVVSETHSHASEKEIELIKQHCPNHLILNEKNGVDRLRQDVLEVVQAIPPLTPAQIEHFGKLDPARRALAAMA